MKRETKRCILSIVLCFIPTLVGLILWERLPEMIPTHYNFSGEADGFSSRQFAVFGMPAILALIDALALFGMRKDPKREKQSKSLQGIIDFVVPALSCILLSVSYVAALGHAVDVSLVILLIIGMLFIVIGNYLPKCRQNYTMGIRLPWTLHSADNWNFTHRFGGICFLAAGLGFVVLAFVRIHVLMVISFLLLFAPMIASYIYYRRHGEGGVRLR